MQDQTAQQILAELARLSRAVESLAPTPRPAIDFEAADCFVWNADAHYLAPVGNPNRIDIGLIKGVVDGVDQVLEAQWVEPHVLDAPQIKTLSTRLGEWAGRVQETLVFIENQTPDMFKE